MRRFTLFVLLFAAMLAARPVYAASLSVPCGDGAGLEAAINQANAPETLTLNPTQAATCSYAIDDTLFVIGSQLTINGNGSVIQGLGMTALEDAISISPGAVVVIDGVTIQSAGDDGIVNNGTLTLSNSTIIASGSDGVVNQGVVTLREVALNQNGGHGLYSTTDGPALSVTAYVVHSTLNGNGLYGLWSEGDTQVVNTVIAENAGGGIRMAGDGHTLNAANVLLHNNAGGAVQIGTQNSAQAYTVSLRSATLADNGGAALTANDISSVTVYNSVIWGNAGSDHGPAEVDVASNTIAQGGVIGLGVDPVFINPVADDYRLGAGSPAINAGDGAYLPFDLLDVDGDADTIEVLPWDLEGATRIQGGQLDIGAYESSSEAGPLFVDVPSPNQPAWFQEWIELYYEAGITKGCGYDPETGDRYYCPEADVNRAEMAVFLLRARNYPDLPHVPRGATPDTFVDVPSDLTEGGKFMEDWIEEFYTLGITKGCGINPLAYCPMRSVTRADMAVFIVRALEITPDDDPNDPVLDIPYEGMPPVFEAYIETFYHLGITKGCGVPPSEDTINYCPEEPVSRGAMAVFILRAFDTIPDPDDVP